MESLLSTREPQKKGSPMLAVVLTLLVAGAGFAAYWYLKQPPAPAAAGVNTPAPAKPKDPLLDFLLADEPKPSEKGDSPAASRRAGARARPAFRAAPGRWKPTTRTSSRSPAALEGEVAKLRRVSARHGLNATLQITAGEPVYRSYYTQLPVALTAQGDFKGVLAWLTDLHHSCPAASVGELKISARRESPTSSPKSSQSRRRSGCTRREPTRVREPWRRTGHRPAAEPRSYRLRDRARRGQCAGAVRGDHRRARARGHTSGRGRPPGPGQLHLHRERRRGQRVRYTAAPGAVVGRQRQADEPPQDQRPSGRLRHAAGGPASGADRRGAKGGSPGPVPHRDGHAPSRPPGRAGGRKSVTGGRLRRRTRPRRTRPAAAAPTPRLLSRSRLHEPSNDADNRAGRLALVTAGVADRLAGGRGPGAADDRSGDAAFRRAGCRAGQRRRTAGLRSRCCRCRSRGRCRPT